MKTIYMSIPRSGGKRFDKDSFPKEITHPISAECAFLNKPDNGLWGSPFNNDEKNTWETFYYRTCLSSKNVYQGTARKMADTNSRYFHKQLEQKFHIGWNQYINMSQEELDKFKEQLQFPFSEGDIKKAMLKDEQRRLNDIKNIRERAFFFIVDDTVILHVKSFKDIEPYLIENEPAPLMSKYSIDFDAMHDEGYHGIDLTMCSDFKNVFYAWDVSSIVLWDVSTVEEVQPELARLSRLSYSNTNLIDQNDRMMSKDFLIDYMKDNLEALIEAEKKGICTYDDVYKAIVDSDGKDIGHEDKVIDGPTHER